MNRKTALILFLTTAITSCGGAPDPSDAITSGAPAERQSSPPKNVNADSGSIDVVASGNTIERNSRGDADSVQCQLGFTVTNRGSSEIKSLLINFDVVNQTTAEVIKAGSQMVIATNIGVGATASPWGSEIVDDFRCADLLLKFPEQPSYQCRTTTSATCAGFTYASKDGVAVERAVASN